LHRRCLDCSIYRSVYHSGPLRGVNRNLATATTLPPGVDGAPLVGADGRTGSDHHLAVRHRWQPRGLLPAGPAAATTEDEENIDGGPLGGADGRIGNGHHLATMCQWWAP
jgi:hypothetical protein